MTEEDMTEDELVEEFAIESDEKSDDWPLDATEKVGKSETAEDPESAQEREAAEYADKLNELHDELDEIKTTGRELHQTLHEKADSAETMQLEKRYRRLAGSAFNLFGRLRDGDQEVLRGGINQDNE